MTEKFSQQRTFIFEFDQNSRHRQNITLTQKNMSVSEGLSVYISVKFNY